MPGFGSGFLRGYTTVRGLQDREAALNYKKQRDVKSDEQFAKQFGLQEARFSEARDNRDEDVAYRAGRDEKNDDYREEQAKGTADYRDKTLGLAQQRVNIAKQTNALAQQEAQRKRDEEQRRRVLTAGYNEFSQTGRISPGIAQALKDAGTPIEVLADPEVKQGIETFSAFMEGAPISRDVAFQAGGKVFNHRFQRAVGKQTPDGDTITSAKFADVIPGKKKGTIIFEGEFTTDKGRTYKAPMTVNGEISDSAPVAQVPVKNALGYIKGVGFAQRALGPAIKRYTDAQKTSGQSGPDLGQALRTELIMAGGKVATPDKTKREIAAMTARGIPEAWAQDVAYGNVASEMDQFGNITLINKATGETRTVGGGGQSAGAAQGSGLTERQAAPQGQGNVFENVDKGTGPWAGIQALSNSFIGPFIQGTTFPETAEARSGIRNFNQEAKTGLVNNPRFPVAEQEIVQELLPDPKRFWTDPDAEREKLVELRTFLTNKMAQNTQSIESGAVTKKEIGRLSNQNEALRRVLGLMGPEEGGEDAQLPAGMPAGSKAIGKVDGKPVYETPDGRRLVVE